MDDANTKLAFSRGFDAGNYGNAYESDDWDAWYAERCVVPEEFASPLTTSLAYREGLLLGFFSSYETHEIPDELVAEEVAALRLKRGQDGQD